MSNKTNEEITNLEKQLKLLKQKQQVEEENKQLKDDVAYLRKSQERKDKQQEEGMRICRGCATQIIILLIGIPILLALFTK